MHETKGISRHSRGKELAGKLTLGFLFIAAPIGTSFLGWRQGAVIEEKANQTAVEEVVRLRRCQEIIHKLPDRILLSSIDEEIATTCSVPTKTDVALSTNEVYDVAFDASTLNITLPTDNQLDQQISSGIIEAKNFNSETQIRYALAFGLILGAGIDLVMFGATIDS